MKQFNFNTPILLIVFKRPDTTLKVFDEIRRIKPLRLFVSADGFRDSIEGERDLCYEVRKIIREVDWDCEVKYLFQDKNLGSALSVTQAISWAFETVDKCIILEDDTLPNDSFWYFMEEMLNKYENDKSIMQINGLSPYKSSHDFQESYTFSKCLYHCWGWATWKHSWEKFDFTMAKYEVLILKSGLKNIIKDPVLRYLYNRNFLKHKFYFPKSWDGRWVASCLYEDGIAIVPLKNMVINLGLNHEFASHTTEGEHAFSNLKFETMKFPLCHPVKVSVIEKLEEDGLKSFFNISISKILKVLFKKPKNEFIILYSHIRDTILKY